MNAKPDIRGYINPFVPGTTEAGQREGMDGEVYVEHRRGYVIGQLINSVRPGSVIAVKELYCLAPGNFRPQKRRRLLAERVEAIKRRGGSILELATGYSSKNGHLPRMLLTAYEQIATSGRARRRDKTGRPPREWTAHELEVMQSIWNSRRYSNDDKRVTAIKANIGRSPSRSWLRLKFGGTS